jgi:hypothetical protein
MADGFKDGYDKGKKAADSNKDRDLRPPIVKSVANETYRATYTEGYKTGYRDGKRDEKKT